MTKYNPLMEVTRRYGHTVYTISVFGSPDSAHTYEEQLLHLIRHEAEKMDSSDNHNNHPTTNNEK